MTTYKAPVADMMFALLNLPDSKNSPDSPATSDSPTTSDFANPEELQVLLEEAGRFATEVIAPTNRIGDQQGSTRNADGSVSTPEGFPEAYKAYQEAGWGAAAQSEEWGGGGMSGAIGFVFSEMLCSANMAFSLCPLLTQAAIGMLEAHGSEDQKTRWLPKLISGEWAGTMNLTEPQAGSDVGALSAKAVRQPDGTYRIFGQKIFITWGQHDMADNIVHLVLARTPDAPPGTRGISCFIVPKFLVNPDGSLGEQNDVGCLSIEHKLGIHASPTCVMQYGEKEGAVTEIIGEENMGIVYMFTMMNNARLGVGMQGLAVSETAYQQALSFARERRQGRGVAGSPSSETAEGAPKQPEQVPIISHPDVKRMLMTMKSVTEAMRSLVYWNAALLDKTGDPKAQERADLLTPLSKAWCTDWAEDIASLNIQIHGGMGYVEETGAAQLYRDIRIASIYEGTNGIQALDLVGRKLPMSGGQVIADLLSEIAEVQNLLPDDLQHLWSPIADALDAVSEATKWLSENSPEDAQAGATPYLRMLATTVAAWLMAKSAIAAHSANQDTTHSLNFLQTKQQTAHFFITQILPPATSLLPSIKCGSNALETIN